MAGSVELATAYVQLVPSAKGIEGAIATELGGPATAAGTAAGGKFGAGFNKGAAVVGAAGVAALVAGASSFVGFEQQMNEVFTLIPQAGQETFDQLTDQSKAFAKEFGVLPNDVVPALYQSISAGVPTDNVFAFLETAQQAAKGGVTDLATAVDGITSVTNAYGQEVISATEASDLMFTAVKGGKTDFGQLSSSLFNVIPTASSLGVEFGNVTAALATMTAAGTPTSVATTQLRQLLIELSKSGSKTAKQFEELSGQSFRDFVAGGGDVAGALAIMQDGADDAGLSLADMFGSSEAAAAAQSLTGANAEKFATELANAAGAAGATEAAFEQMEQGIGPVIDKLKAEFAVALIDLGTAIAPALKIIAGGVLGIVKVFTALPGPVRSGIVLALTAVAGFAAIAGPAAKAISALKGVGAAFKLLAANPYVLLIAATIVIAIVIYKNWDAIKAFLISAWDAIVVAFDATVGAIVTAAKAFAGAMVTAFEAVVGAVVTAAKAVGSAFMTMVDGLVTGAKAVASAFVAAWEFVKGVTVTVWQAITGAITAALDAITGAMSAAWEFVRSLVSTVLEAIRLVIVTYFEAYKLVITTALEIIRSIVQAAWDGLLAITSAVWGAIQAAIGVATTGIENAIYNVTHPVEFLGTLFDGLLGIATRVWDGLRSVIGGAVDFLIGKIDALKRAAADALGPLGSVANAGGSFLGGAAGLLGFDEGGTVPGPRGAPRLILAHGGETVLPTHREPQLLSLAASGSQVSRTPDAMRAGETTYNDFRGLTVRDDSDLRTIVRTVNNQKRARGIPVLAGSEGLNW